MITDLLLTDYCLLITLFVRTREEPEQWQVIVQMVIQRRAEVLVYSGLPDEKVLGAKLQPCHDIAQAVRERLARAGGEARVAVLPQGPLTIPYLG